MKIDFLENNNTEGTKKKFPLLWKSAIALGIIAPLFFIQMTFLGSFNPFLKIGGAIENFGFSNVTQWVSQIGKLIRSNDKMLAGESDDRINFLLLGMGGPGHDGAYLTDTMILASFEPKEKKLAMVSIPRDLLVQIPGYGSRKINNINAFAEAKEKGSGGQVTMETVSQILDIPIQYYIRADFEGFKTLIDKLGGVSVYVDNSFVDYQYPTNDDLYQTLSFDAGWQKMDGDTALKFVRSRHGTNGEASDFARSRRQEKVLLALKDKVFSLGTLLNPLKIQSVFDTVKNSVDTNMEMWEIVRLGSLVKDVDTSKIVHQVISADPGGLLVAANVDGAYVLLPRTGNFDEIQFLIKNIFDLSVPATPETKPVPTTVEIQNGTKKTGLAGRTATMLEKLNYKIVKIGNAADQTYPKTVIYDLTDGAKNEELNFLKDKFDADVSLSGSSLLTSSVTPSEVNLFGPPTDGNKTSADFLIVLGANANF